MKLRVLARASVNGHKATDQRRADIEDELERLGRLHDAHLPRHHPKDARLSAGWNVFGCWWAREEAPVARTVGAVKDGDLPPEAKNCSVYQRLARQAAGIRHQIPGGKVVGTVQNQVVVGDELLDIAAVDTGRVLDNGNMGIEAAQVRGRGLEFCRPLIRGRVENLALKIGDIHLVEFR
jgi:hypothetical protein